MTEKKTIFKAKETPKVEPKVEPKPERVNERVRQNTMASRYRNEKQVEISISPLYANEFSRNMPIVLNGIRISIPVDGKPYKIPHSFALEVRNRIAAADEKFKRLSKMADVQNNMERSPGELKLFR